MDGRQLDVRRDDFSGGALTADAPVNPYSLLQAVNDNSEIAHTGWLIFLAVVAYFCIAVAGVTHTDLLLNSAVALPIMQVSIDLTRFFLFAPVLVVFLHFGILMQLTVLARKVLEFDAAVRPLETTSRRTHPLRLELHSFFFTQLLAGPERSALYGSFLHGMFWLSVIGLPILVILYIQIVFLPYHDVTTTWAHRLALLADALVLVCIGVFLGSRSTSFFRAFWRTASYRPLGFLLTAVMLIGIVLFSFFVATVPGEALDRYTRTLQLPGTQSEPAAQASSVAGDRTTFALTALFFGSGEGAGTGWIRSLFNRNLVVTDEDVLRHARRDQKGGKESTGDDTGDMSEAVRVSLRGRDLRFAVLDRSVFRRVDFTGADLDGASLVRADLRGAKLSCSDFDDVLKGKRDRVTSCTRLAGADLSRANLAGTDLKFALMPGAKLENADLVDADLRYAQLTGAKFAGATLRRANLSGSVDLMGANFLGADLQGADLTGAKLHGAEFPGASLEGAQLNFAHAFGANFQGAMLDGVSFNAARLQGADFTDASLRGTDLSAATLWSTTPPTLEKLESADISQARIRPMDETEINQVRVAIDGIAWADIRATIDRKLERLLDGAVNASWDASPEAQAWSDIKQRNGVLDQATYASVLTGFLGNLGCQARFSDGSVASGLVRRALGTNYKGAIGALLQRLRSGSCPGARELPEELMQRLAAAAEEEAVAP